MLRDLPLPVKLVISVFLISVGLGYLTAMVQLHFQHASPGELLPTVEDAEEIFNGKIRKRDGDNTPPKKPVSKLESLITAPESLPWNGQGSMAAAFTTRSIDWEDALDEFGGDESKVRQRRDTERAAMVAWINSGKDRKATFEKDSFPLGEKLKGDPINELFLNEDGSVMIQTLVMERCSICHSGGQNGPDFDTYEDLVPFMELPKLTSTGESLSPRRMSVEKLAQSTHAHWLSFAMLFGLTGLVFASTSYPMIVRLLLAPAVLIMQMIDISCWWLSRLEASTGLFFAQLIPITGILVAVGLVSQIVLSLFNIYGTRGRAVLAALFIGAGVGLFALKTYVIDPQLKAEREAFEKSGVGEPTKDVEESPEEGAGVEPTTDGGTDTDR